jgi:hypothetical protein
MNKLFKHKKGFQSKTGIILVFVFFYTALFIFIGYINNYYNIEAGVTTVETGVNPNCDCGAISCGEYKLIFGKDSYNTLCGTNTQSTFLGNVISGIADIPWWLNTLLFGSFIIILIWIVTSSLPTLNGGS